MSTKLEYNPTDVKPWRVLIIDDQPLYRIGLKELLTTEGGFKVCGEAACDADALNLCRDLQPDLLTLEGSPAKENNLQLVEKIRAEHPAISILIASPLQDRAHADRALTAGANGYICKRANPDEFRTALRALKSGQSFASDTPDCSSSRSNGGAAAEETLLSSRELQIFRLIGHGATTQSIAQQLSLATSTVETYRERIKSKLDIPTGAELTRRAILWVIGRG